MMKFKNINYYFLLIFFTALLTIPFTGRVHLFDWDEINFAESAREMIETGDYLTVRINFEPFWEKPPLFIWLQVLSMKIFGINEFAARFPNAIAGILTVIVLFFTGTKLKDRKFGFLWVLGYMGSILPFLYFKSGIIDPWFNLFIFLGIHCLILFTQSTQKRYLLITLSALFIGLAILTKGPVALLVFLLTTGIVWIIRRFTFNFREIILFIGVLAFVGGFWFILQMLNGNFKIIEDFIVYQIRLFQTKDAGHGGFLLYHFVVLLTGVFPASVLALPVIFHPKQEEHSELLNYGRWMLVLFLVVLILFTIVKTKIVHYSSLCYFPLSYFAAQFFYRKTNEKAHLNRLLFILIWLMGTLYLFFTALLPFLDILIPKLLMTGIIKDPFAEANLQADVKWQWWTAIPSAIMLAGLLVFTLFNKKRRLFTALLMLFITTLLFTFTTVLLITPKIEAYSQRSAIEFYESRVGEECYIETLGFKSYAHLFYAKKKIPENKSSLDKQWLLYGEIDKVTYFVTKVHRKKKEMAKYPQLEYIYEKNGFVFLKREPLKPL